MAKKKNTAEWEAPPPIEGAKIAKHRKKNFLEKLAKERGFEFRELPKEPLYK